MITISFLALFLVVTVINVKRREFLPIVWFSIFLLLWVGVGSLNDYLKVSEQLVTKHEMNESNVIVPVEYLCKYPEVTFDAGWYWPGKVNVEYLTDHEPDCFKV